VNTPATVAPVRNAIPIRPAQRSRRPRRLPLPAAAAPEAELSRWGRFELRGATLTSTGDDEDSTLTVTLVDGGEEKHLTASGNGPLDAFVTALEQINRALR